MRRVRVYVPLDISIMVMAATDRRVMNDSVESRTLPWEDLEFIAKRKGGDAQADADQPS